ncbi:MAG: GPW/gp25 family protein [Candidatus Nanoarchaeia archaeon]|nr:GPW/gp25 family protein [Candidatus Nanoarchaeia archaeon]
MIRELSDNWAYDIAKNPISNGEIKDVEVINQSIEMILGIAPGERLFNTSFGLGLQNRIFNIASPEEGESILDQISEAIKTWEDRITLVESQMQIKIEPDNNMIVLIIPYIIKRNKIKSVFQKKIYG